jgi:hypothetical protein
VSSSRRVGEEGEKTEGRLVLSLFSYSCSPCRDVAWLGDCDQGCLALADLLGWKVRSWATPAHPEPRPMGFTVT